MLTQKEMNDISNEITYIEKRLDVLSPSNAIERQERSRLLKRLDFLEYHVQHLKPLPSKRQKNNCLRVIK